ncbi:MAG TPA: thiamine diphosphokinase [Ardenticatenaceae bacterium]|nr:thiamine diphosphokinase [Ardenticatenaceae bacterium]
MRIVLFGNGDLQDAVYERGLIRESDQIYCANGGTRHAFALGLVPDLVIGDTDSLPENPRRWLLENEVPVQSHPPQKDQTDLELAVHVAIARGARALLLLGGAGGRIDHTFGNLSLLVAARRANVRAELVTGREHCIFIEDEAIVLEGEPRQTLSLLPWGRDARGVSAEGVFWPLHDETLVFGENRGISNLFMDRRVRISVRDGALLIVHHRGPVR